jgi:hypothetical protein
MGAGDVEPPPERPPAFERLVGQGSAAGTWTQSQPSLPAAVTTSTLRWRHRSMALSSRNSARPVELRTPLLMFADVDDMDAMLQRPLDRHGEIDLTAVDKPALAVFRIDRDDEAAAAWCYAGVTAEDDAGDVSAVIGARHHVGGLNAGTDEFEVCRRESRVAEMDWTVDDGDENVLVALLDASQIGDPRQSRQICPNRIRLIT